MKRIFCTVLIIVVMQCSHSAEKKQGVLFTVTNPISLVRVLETVTVPLAGLYVHHPEWKNEQLSIYKAKKELVSQMVDNNGDGTADELIFQMSFQPKETVRFEVYRKSSAPAPSSVVDVRYVLPREDLAWENDRIAFRIYGNPVAGNVDNGIDVWTKRVGYPIVAKWYKESEGSPAGKDTYHQDRGEGADFFSVGRSLGAGSAGLFHNGVLRQGGLFTTFRILTNGPIRVSFEVFYAGWRLDTLSLLERKRITLDAGEQLNRIDEEFISKTRVPAFTIAAGVVKRSGTSVYRSSDTRRLSLWGPTTSDTANGTLGTAVVMPFAPSVHSSEDSTHFLLSTSVPGGSIFTYYSGATWSRRGDISSATAWNTYLDEFVERKKFPLIVAIVHSSQ